MKKLFGILAVIALTLALGHPAYAENPGANIVHAEKYAKYDKQYGVDVSTFQKVIDWKAVKASGIDFAIIRLGYRGYETGSLNTDRYFEQNIKGAHAAGLDVGVYFFTEAISLKEAREEAKYCAQVLKPYSSYVTLPVYMDMERIGPEARFDQMNFNARQKTDLVLEFCKTIEKYGYEGGSYGSKSHLLNEIYIDEISDKYSIWLAHYTNETTYPKDYDIWQYTSTGSVPGIVGNVDRDVRYVFHGTPKIASVENTTDGITIRWDAKKGVKNYAIYRKTSGSSYKKIATVKNATGYTDVKAEPGVKYTYAIQYLSSAGRKISDRSAGVSQVFVSPTSLKDPVLSENGITLKWTVPKNITGYEIKYATNKSFNKAQTITIKKASSKKKLIKDIKVGKTLYARIRTYKTVGKNTYYGAWSKTVSIKVTE